MNIFANKYVINFLPFPKSFRLEIARDNLNVERKKKKEKSKLLQTNAKSSFQA
jgi:hypothetical protein